MEIVDELVTPGCPQCAIKHMSAAIALMAGPYPEGQPVPQSLVWVAVARINLAEVLVGYRSHLWYAVGMLVRAEEAACLEGTPCPAAREARLILEMKGCDGAHEALRTLAVGTILTSRVQAEAHLYEASRELPSLLVYPLIPEPEYLIEEIERVRSEFFVPDEASAASTEDAERGGESDMATKKSVKAAPAKAKQACGKGGCSKKGKK